MPSPFSLEADALAPVLHAAIERLGELGPSAMDALLEHLRNQPVSPDFDAGFDLLFAWLAIEDTSQPGG